MSQEQVLEYPQEMLDLFRQHRHHRSEFMTRAANLGGGGVAAGALFEALSARPVEAQEVIRDTPVMPPRSVQRVAVIGAGHYHATAAPGYLKILRDLHLDIVGLHDFDPTLAKSRAEMVHSTAYTDYKLMCEKCKPDFVLTLCRHDIMAEPIRYLINAGIPFMAEKPWGTNAKTVNDLADLADKKKAWATFPASMRYSQWAQTCREMVQKNQLGPISHIIVRFNQPGVQRYIDEGSPWMLSKKEAGGGPLLNLGIHGFDLCTYITGEIPKVVGASTSHNLFNLSIEDYAFVTLRTPSGMTFINEAGYSYPTTGSDSQRMLSAKNFIVGTPGDVGTLFGPGAGLVAGGAARAAGTGAGAGARSAEGGAAAGAATGAGARPAGARSGLSDSAQVVGPGRNETINAPPGYVGGWPGAVSDAIERLRKGQAPSATAQDNARAVTLTFDAYRMAGEKS